VVTSSDTSGLFVVTTNIPDVSDDVTTDNTKLHSSDV
jgi:hypothetical protein